MSCKWCKFCKHGFPHFENGKCVVYCHLSFFADPAQKDPFDTCEAFEDEDEEDNETI